MSHPSSASIPSGRPNTRATSRTDSTPAAEPTHIAGTMPTRPILVLSSATGTPTAQSRPLAPGLAARPTTVPPAAGSPFLTANITSTAPIVAAAAAAAVDAARAAKATTAHDKSAPQMGNSATVATLGEHGQCSNVNSPTPGAELSLPLSMMVSAAASALHTAPAADPMQDFPALPAPGEEAMTTSAAVRRRATKRAAPREDSPPPTPLTDDSSMVAIGVEAASEARSDADTDNYHLAAETARAVAASLGQDVEASAPSASTSHPPAPPASSCRGPSPPKRPRIDTGSALFAPDT
ncbi:hypothetical protein C8J57DRAFT_1540125 [Mycena rebaudengoi]|nr:hypothetical protein C8J57DRAFT_1540125 [Mycena rebaudengoi]